MAEAMRFPDIPLYAGWGAPVRAEAEARDLEIIAGAVPPELDGTLYRCGPDPQYPPMLGEDVFINGDGLVHMLRLADGHVDYRSRYVRTQRFLLQEKARRSLFGRYRNRYTNDPSVAGADNGTANTNIIWHGGKLLVLKEDSLPIELDPDTLATHGKWDYAGAVGAVCLTAHPKLDPISGELLTHANQARGDGTTDIAYYVVDRHGRVAHEVWFHAPFPACVHDFAVTAQHVIFPFFPLITDLEVLKRGGPFYQWHPDRESVFAILSRYGSAQEIRWFRGPAISAGHMMNAVTEGTLVHLDLCLYQGNCFPFFPMPDGQTTAPVPPLLTRLTFDLAGNAEGFLSRRLASVPCEMPRTDDRYQGRPYRHGYAVSFGGARERSSAVGHIDLATGALETWDPGEGSGVQEPCFVPRRPDAPEGEGWLLALVNRMQLNRSELAVLDAKRVADGPVALIRLPLRVRSTFHGMWVPQEALRTGQYAFALGS